MRIIAKGEMTNYAQWCSLVVASLFDSRNITFNGEEIDTVEIEAIDEQRIYLSILNLPFSIRIWNSILCEEETDEESCTEMIGYTFYCAAVGEHYEEDFPHGDGEALCGGYLKMQWNYDDISCHCEECSKSTMDWE